MFKYPSFHCSKSSSPERDNDHVNSRLSESDYSQRGGNRDVEEEMETSTYLRNISRRQRVLLQEMLSRPIGGDLRIDDVDRSKDDLLRERVDLVQEMEDINREEDNGLSPKGRYRDKGNSFINTSSPVQNVPGKKRKSRNLSVEIREWLNHEVMDHSFEEYDERFQHPNASPRKSERQDSNTGESLYTAYCQLQAKYKILEQKYADSLVNHEDELRRIRAESAEMDELHARTEQEKKELISQVKQNRECAEKYNAKIKSVSENQRILREMVLDHETCTKKSNRDLKERRFWDEVATAEVLERSLPRPGYPIPRPINPTSELVEARRLLKEAQSQAHNLENVAERLEKANVKLLARCKSLGHEQKRNKVQLMGAVRRIKWLLGMKAQLSKNLEEKTVYCQKLETKLLALHAALKSKSAKSPKRHPSRNPGVVSPPFKKITIPIRREIKKANELDEDTDLSIGELMIKRPQKYHSERLSLEAKELQSYGNKEFSVDEIEAYLKDIEQNEEADDSTMS
eukprot:Nk52_evm63s215 gene=Nk52_evmTU63s215